MLPARPHRLSCASPPRGCLTSTGQSAAEVPRRARRFGAAQARRVHPGQGGTRGAPRQHLVRLETLTRLLNSPGHAIALGNCTSYRNVRQEHVVALARPSLAMPKRPAEKGGWGSFHSILHGPRALLFVGCARGVAEGCRGASSLVKLALMASALHVGLAPGDPASSMVCERACGSWRGGKGAGRGTQQLARSGGLCNLPEATPDLHSLATQSSLRIGGVVLISTECRSLNLAWWPRDSAWPVTGEVCFVAPTLQSAGQLWLTARGEADGPTARQ